MPLQHSKHSKASQAQHAAQLLRELHQSLMGKTTLHIKALTIRSRCLRPHLLHAWTWSSVLWASATNTVTLVQDSVASCRWAVFQPPIDRALESEQNETYRLFRANPRLLRSDSHHLLNRLWLCDFRHVVLDFCSMPRVSSNHKI